MSRSPSRRRRSALWIAALCLTAAAATACAPAGSSSDSNRALERTLTDAGIRLTDVGVADSLSGVSRNLDVVALAPADLTADEVGTMLVLIAENDRSGAINVTISLRDDETDDVLKLDAPLTELGLTPSLLSQETVSLSRDELDAFADGRG